MDSLTGEPALPIERAEKNLQRQVEWIARYDTRSSLAIGIYLAMLGVLATVTPGMAKWTNSLSVSGLWVQALANISLVLNQRAVPLAPGRSGYLFHRRAPNDLSQYESAYNGIVATALAPARY